MKQPTEKPTENATAWLHVRMTKLERAKIALAATTKRLTVSAFAREVLARQADKVI